MRPPLVSRKLTPLATSIALPPPTATRMSARRARATAIAASTSRSVGLASTSMTAAASSPPSRGESPHELEGAGAEQEVDDAALVRLEPVEFDRRDRPEVEPVDVDGVDQLPLPLLVLRDCRAHQRRPDRLQHLLLRALHHRAERE